MPPKKQVQKKGLVYKPAVLVKDIVPATVKELPREPRLIKAVGDFPDQEFKNEFEPKQKLEPWPGNEQAKGFDFGTEQYSDPLNHLVTSFFDEKLVVKWKSMKVIEKLQSYQEQEEQEDDTSIHSIRSQNNVNYIIEDDILEQSMHDMYKTKELVMFDTILRDQTSEEMQKRKTLEAEKALKEKKKPAKKDEIKDEMLPQKIKDIQLSDIQTYNYMFGQAKWIGGHLQLIKDKGLKDVYTGQPIWKKVYPQVDGIPVLSKSGKYWVKLYHMGKEVKIEVDSEFPIDNKCRYLFPISKKHHQKWTLIFTKAIIKLLSIINSPFSMCGDGLTLYSLTGLICQTIPLNSFTNWNKIGEYLKDEHYTNKDTIVTCWSSNKFRPSQVNLVKTSKEYNKLFEFPNSDFKPLKKRLERSNSGVLPYFENHDYREQEQVIQTGVETQYCYLINDYLHNGPLNMAFVQNRSMRQMALRQAYNQLNQVSLSTKTKDQKLQHRKKKKELKQKIRSEEQKRLQIMNEPNKSRHFVKVSSDLKIHCKYSKQQINIAKKCILNNLTKPPNYQVYDPKQQSRSLMSTVVVKKEEAQKDEMTVKALDDFSSIPNVLNPLERDENGVWIQGDDFLRNFEYVQFYYDPTKLTNQVVHKITGQGGVEFTVDETKQVLMVEKLEKQQNISLLFGFAPQYPKQAKSLGRPYSILQKFNFDEYVAIQGTQALEDPLSSFRLQLQNRNHLYKIVTVARAGYSYWLSSNATFRLMSIVNYLTQYQNYTTKQLTTEFPPAQTNKYNLYFRLQITGGQTANSLFIKLRGIDFNILKYLRYKVIKPCPPNDKNLLLQDGKYFEERALIVDLQNKIDIEPNTKYYLLLEGVLPFNLKSNTVDIDIYTKYPLKVELVENVEPLKYLEKYVPNKYGLICRERLFVNTDCVATLFFQVVEAELAAKDTVVTDKKAPPKKPGKEEGVQIPETELKQKRSIRFQLYKNDELIAAKIGSNIALISNIQILSTKQGNNTYFIQAMFNLHDWPEAKDPQFTNNICWNFKITSSESIAVVRDTFQQDKDRQIKKKWQDQDPGRAERAKKSRRRYLLELKQQSGQKLTQQQLAIISQPRLTKKQLLQQEKKLLQDKNKKAPPKKDDKKGKKQQPVKPVIIEQKPVSFPKSSENIMIQLNHYLKHLQGPRVIQLQQTHLSPCIRNDEDIRAIKQASLISQQDRVAHIVRNIRNRETTKIEQNERKQELGIFFNRMKQEMKQSWSKYVIKRNELFEESKQKTQKDKNVIALLRGEKVLATEGQIQKAMKQYEGFEEHNKQLLIGLQMLWKNKKIIGLSQKLTTALAVYDMEQIKRIRETVDKDQVEGIANELMEQFKALEEEYKNNPTAIADKQAQLKKTKKGGKK